MFASIKGIIFNLSHIIRIDNKREEVLITCVDGRFTSLNNCTEHEYQNFINKLKDYNLYLQQEKREYKAPINLL